ncbi:MAG: hypothetical protein RLZZ15_1507 [Verrucomicrobiota bacterium]|jgi:hypothetical protein
MNNTEAKFILDAYRPGGRDAGETAFAAALAQAKADPALGAWFAREQAHGAAVAAKLRAIAPPPGLREAILAGARVSEGNATTAGGPMTTRAWWRQPTWLAVAAAVAIFAAAGAVRWRTTGGAATDAALTTFALGDALETTRHGGHGEPTGALQSALGRSDARLASVALPVDFAALRATGCRTVSVAGRDVLEVCFQRDGAWFHCYVARVTDFPGAGDGAAPSFSEQGGVAAAAWTRGAYRVVLASAAGRAAVQRLL